MKKFTRTLFYALNIMVTAFAREPHCPVCSRYDYEERLLERVLRNEMALDNLVAEIRQTNAEVKAAMKVMQEDKADLATAMTAVKTAQADMKSMLDNAIKGGLLNISTALSAMTTNTTGVIQQMEKENKILKDQLDDAIQGGLLQIYEAVTAMKTNTSVAIQQMEKENKRLKDQLMIPQIYFYARTPVPYSISSGQDIIFTKIEVNEGQCYSAVSGKFTVSVPGIYAFAVQYRIPPNQNTYIDIVIQGTILQRSLFQNCDVGYQCVTMHAFTRAALSDQIWVKSAVASSSNMYDNSNMFTSFSGVLIHL